MATTVNWLRGAIAGIPWDGDQHNVLLGSVASGDTVARTRWQWGMSGITDTDVHAAGIMTNLLFSGIVTTVGNGTETVPSPDGGRHDQDPPTQRWLWWETRVPRITNWDSAGGVATWELTLPAEPTDSKGMVLATGLPAGDTLNLWWTCQAFNPWDSSGMATLWLSYSALVTQG
jgi:hypothetical protein